LCIRRLAQVDIDIAANAVTDGFGDNGIDAVFFDQKKDTLILVQSKWSTDGTKPIDAAGTGAMATGVRDLFHAKFDRFNEKMKGKEAEVRTALFSERPVRFSLVTAHTATQPTDAFVKRKIDDLVLELNDPVQIAESIHLDQAGIYNLITSESRPQKIKLQIALKEWGVIEKPFLAYYGRVHVDDILQWWNDHNNALFTQNLRLFRFSSDVNDALRRTLANEHQYFWYFNNGITVICDSIVKAAVGAPYRNLGLFACEGANIVNGAQMVGTIGDSGGAPKLKSGGGLQEPQESWVQVRIISLEGCPPEFARQITRAANLQNAVGNREFAAMDPVQHRLATDFTLDKRRYVYKQGETDPKGEQGCDIVEATQALACAHSTALSVQVKREIGALWADTNSTPYTDLFNGELSATRVWRSVLIMRAVDEELEKLKQTKVYSAELIAVHLNRLILHLVFNDVRLRSLRHDSADEAECIRAVRQATADVFPRVSAYIQEKHPENYLASFSKNLSRCDSLVKALLATENPKQGSLFDS
jgi:hypothetical protein